MTKDDNNDNEPKFAVHQHAGADELDALCAQMRAYCKRQGINFVAAFDLGNGCCHSFTGGHNTPHEPTEKMRMIMRVVHALLVLGADSRVVSVSKEEVEGLEHGANGVLH